MTSAQPPSTSERLSRLENLFANIGETVLAQNDAIAAINANVNAQSNTIDVLVANIQQLTENVNAVTSRVDNLAIQADRDRQTFRDRMDAIAAQAAQDRQQAAIDRQEFRNEIRQIWEYLRDRNGGSSPQW
ncbi:MAG: hypothetical protein SAK29_38875 [Scytonema sp. PMC 1069.18]|nr:hypothetical protein [Scytonema sp. PMC 1069.18]MEC4886348.1 hypothetical protein [Scytonema sp. PMC 1070.18]